MRFYIEPNNFCKGSCCDDCPYSYNPTDEEVDMGLFGCESIEKNGICWAADQDEYEW